MKPEVARHALAEGWPLELREDWAKWNAAHKDLHRTTGAYLRDFRGNGAESGMHADVERLAARFESGKANASDHLAAADHLDDFAHNGAESGMVDEVHATAAKLRDTARRPDMDDKSYEAYMNDKAKPSTLVYKGGAKASNEVPAWRKQAHRSMMMTTALQASALDESKKTAMLSTTHAPIGKGGTNWITRTAPGNTGQLPAYIQNIRNAIMRSGKSESDATGTAIAAVKRWAAGAGGVSAEVKAAAAKAVAQWESLKAKSAAKGAAKKAA